MALRHLNPINDNAIQLMADPLISAAPWLEIADESLETKAEPAVQPVQALAEEMEVARKKLLHLLLEKDFVAKLLSEQLITKAEEGVDYSLNNSEKTVHQEPVQELEFVQVNTIEELVVDQKPAAIANQRDYNLQQAHIFPVFLLKIAEQAQKKLAEPEYTDVAYRSRLIAYRMNLQQVRQKMIASNTGLVAFVACKYKTQCLSFEDLMQEGSIGLIKAVDRFDASRGIRFSTYAIFWIKQAISRLIVKQEKVVRLPIALAEKASVVFEVMRNSYLEHNRWPSLLEIKAQCDLSMDDIKTISSYYQSTHSLDSAQSDDGDDQTLMATLPQHQFAQPLNELIDSNLSLYIGKVVASLPEKEAAILNMRFGLQNHHEMTLQAIADQLHVTRERVRQIQNDALKKLKQQFGYDLLPFLEPNQG
ncbi:MAG: RNA polymerase sigma factor RpoD/SigA [Methylomonas sp.]